MYYERLPKEEHKRVIELVEQVKLKELLEIHNKYKLTKYNYNCCDLYGMLDWYRHGIANGQIKAD